MTTLLPPADLTAVAGPVLRPGDPGWPRRSQASTCPSSPRPPSSSAPRAPPTSPPPSATPRASASASPYRPPGTGCMSDLDDTVLITTRRMTTVAVDPVARTARVGAGVRWREVIDAAAPHGLAPLNGSSSQVGVVGYTTGGGLGPLARRYGFAADHVTPVRRSSPPTARPRGPRREHRPRRRRPVLGRARRQGQLRDRHRDRVRPRAGGDGSTAARSSSLARTPPRCCTPGGSGRRRCPRTRRRRSRCCACRPSPELPEPLRGRFVVALRFTHLGRPTGAALLAPMRAVAPAVMDVVARHAVRGDRRRAHGPDRADARRGTAAPRWPSCPPRPSTPCWRRRAPTSASPLTMVEIRLLGGALARAAAGAQRRDRPRRRVLGLHRRRDGGVVRRGGRRRGRGCGRGTAAVGAWLPDQLPRPGRAGAGRPAVGPG